jgi:xanthine dehydrogenase accessory factor
VIENRAVFEAALEAESKGQPVALATVIQATGSVPRHEGSKMLVRPDGSIVGTVGGGKMEALVIEEGQRAIADGRTRSVSYALNDLKVGDPGICGGTVQVFIEPLASPPTLVVIGGGHVGKALGELGKWSGFRVILTDDRAEYCNPTVAPGLDGYVVCKPEQVADQVTINPQTYVAAVTRGLPIDVDLIPSLLKTSAAYIGLIGSRRRWALTIKALKEQRGLTEADLQRVYAPIGLELNGETPQEIAVSIMAEITMLRRGGTGQPMKWMGEPEVASAI